MCARSIEYDGDLMDKERYDALALKYCKANERLTVARRRVQDLGRDLKHAHTAERQADRDQQVAWAELMDYIYADVDTYKGKS